MDTRKRQGGPNTARLTRLCYATVRIFSNPWWRPILPTLSGTGGQTVTLNARRMTTRSIHQAQLPDLYGVDVAPTVTSNLTASCCR